MGGTCWVIGGVWAMGGAWTMGGVCVMGWACGWEGTACSVEAMTTGGVPAFVSIED